MDERPSETPISIVPLFSLGSGLSRDSVMEAVSKRSIILSITTMQRRGENNILKYIYKLNKIL